MLRLPFRQAFEDLRDHLTEAQWDMLRIAGVLIVVGGLSAGVYWIGQPRWRRWQNHQALAQASHFAVERDYRSMLLALRRATELEPGDRATWEEAARDLGGIGSPEELVAREQLVRLSPEDTPSRLELAHEALRFGRYDSAREALDGLPSGAPHDLAYQRIAVAVALAENNPPEALRQLQRLIALDPRDSNARFTYAAMRLWSVNAAERTAARGELDGLLTDPATRIRAAIELVTDAALRTSHGSDPGEFHRLMIRLMDVFSPDEHPQWVSNELQVFDLVVEGMKQAVTAPTDAALMARWLVQLKQPRDALAWLDARPAPLGTDPLVAETVAEIAAETGNDAVLERRLKAGAWGSWPEGAWEKAIAAHRAGKPPNDPAWTAAIAACGDSLDALRNLGRLVGAWREWPVADAAWLAILDRDPGVDWAYQTLRADYISRGDEAGLYSLYTRREQNRPDDERAAAEWVTLACLLDRTSAAVYQRAETLGRNSPDAIIAQAAALWRREEPVEASEMIDRLPAGARGTPSATFWNAVIKSELPEHDAARAALARALATPRLPAERSLLAAAEAKAGYVAASPQPTY